MYESGGKLLAVGSTLNGRYAIRKPLYRTVDAEFYLAEDYVLRKNICIKILSLEQMEDASAVARIEQEARIFARSDHKNFLKLSGFSVSGTGQAFIACELAEGIRLDSFVISRASLEFEEALPLIAEICDALEYAHQQNILFREIKPESILLCADKSEEPLKILEMSSAVFRAESSHLYEEAHPALLNQSACFSSPEVLLGKNIDERSDVFALGCISYFMLCGRAAYLNGQIKNAIKEHGFISPPKFKNIISSDSILTYKAEPIIRKALELNAADRFSSAREFIDELIFTTGVESVACLDELLDEIRKHYISWLRRSYS